MDKYKFNLLIFFGVQDNNWRYEAAIYKQINMRTSDETGSLPDNK